MSINCRDASYTIKKVDTNTASITVNKGQIDQTSLDITLLGKRRREYGEIFNENLLRILENFSSPEDALNPGNPDPSGTSGNVLSNPTSGQLWHNSTDNRIYHFTGLEWKVLNELGDVAGNSGTIFSGEQLPRPVSPYTGYIFPYEECSWIVAPAYYDEDVEYMACYTDDQATVTFEYRRVGEGSLTPGVVTYQIVGIRDNNSLGALIPPTPAPTVTPSISVSASSTPIPTATPTPTPTPSTSIPASPGATPSPTPTPSVTPSVTPTSSVTPTPGLSPTPTPSVTPTSSVTPSITPSITPTSSVTPTPTPTPSPEAQSGALIPFGTIPVELFEVADGTYTYGIVLNGYTSEFNTGNPDTRYHYRLETTATDNVLGPIVDMGATIGNEPAEWEDEYWAYFDVVDPPNLPGSCANIAAGSASPSTWVNLGNSNDARLLYNIVLGTGCPTSNSFIVNVYMKRSVGAPAPGTSGATLMGSLQFSVSSDEPL